MSSSTTTGDITISLDCATPPACSVPTLALAIQGEEGEAIDCLDFGTSYYVLASLAGGEGNDSYNVVANGAAPIEVDADGSVVLGPFAQGVTANVSVVGVQDEDCGVTTSIASPAICPPVNDDCDGALVINCGETILGSTAGASSSGLPATCAGYTSSSALDLFYTFEADGTSDYLISLDQAPGSYFDGILFVYSGTCGDLTSLGCSDYGNPEEMELLAPEAGTYTIRFYRYSSTGAFALGLECTENIVYDCPEIEANYGDVCYDDAQNEGVIDDNCGCYVAPVFDCPEIEANYGDACDDGDDSTENDIINVMCECIGTPIVTPPSCEFVYYLSDHDSNDGIADIYGVTLSGGIATMNLIATSDIEVHIAYNAGQKLIYAISKHNNSYRTLDPANGDWGIEVPLGQDLGEVTAAVFNHDGKLVLGSQNHKVIYSVNVITNVVSTYDTYAPVYGGDLAFGSDGMLYLATRAGNGLYQVWTAPTNDNLIGYLPSLVTGMAITDADQLLISAQGNSSLVLRNTDGTNPSVSFDLMLDGEPYTLRDGDMASGCKTPDDEIGYCLNFTTFLANHGAGISGSDIYKVSFSGGNANLTFLTNVEYETHIAFDAVSNILYLVNVDGSFVRSYDVSLTSFGVDLPIIGDFTKLTAAVFNPADGLLYVGDHSKDEIHTIDPANGTAAYYADAPVSGGDLEILDDGTIYLGTKQGSALYKIVGGAAVMVGNMVPNVTGMARANDNADSFITSNNGATVLTKIDAANGSTIVTYPIKLGGVDFTLADGDMASGCNPSGGDINGCANYKLYYVHSAQGGGPSPLLEVTLNSDGTASYTTVMPNLGGHIGVSPDGSVIYAVIGNKLKTVEISSASILTNLTIKNAGGTALSGFPAVMVSQDGTIYAGRSTNNQVYTIDPITAVATPFGPSRSVSGGDLIEVEGEIWLITRNNNKFTNVLTGDSFTVPVTEINGAVVLGNGNVLLSDGNGGSLLKEIDLSTQAVVATYDIGLPLHNGDLAGVCISDDLGDVTPPTNPFIAVGSNSTLTSYPNPTKGPSKVVFTTGVTTRTLVDVYDMNGRNVATLFNQEAQKGKEYTLDFNGSNLPNGVYIYRMTTNNESIIEKFMIAR